MNRRILMFVMIALASVSLCGATAYAQNKKVPRKQLKSLVNKYKGEDGFDGLNIGRLTMNMMRAAAKSEADGDAESAAALDLMSSLTGMTVADYEDCSVKVRKAFNRDLERMLNGVELLMSVKEDGDNVFIYGHILPNGKEVEDVVISVPGDGALVCFFGRIDMDKVGAVVKVAEE